MPDERKVAPRAAMRQPLRMNKARRHAMCLLLLALSGCGPYQTYSPGTAPLPVTHTTAIPVYGTKTTTADNEMDLTDLQPTPPAPAAAASPPASTSTTEQRIAICYSRLWSSADAVHSAATQACGNGTPRIVSQDTDLGACPALTPTHAVFACGP
jgi:hypothetical protein